MEGLHLSSIILGFYRNFADLLVVSFRAFVVKLLILRAKDLINFLRHICFVQQVLDVLVTVRGHALGLKLIHRDEYS